MHNSLDGFAAFLSRRYQNHSTPKHYVSDLSQFLTQLGGNSLEAATGQDIDAFIDAQIVRCLRTTTINRRLASIYAFFDYLAEGEPDRKADNPVRWLHHRLKTPELLPRDASDRNDLALLKSSLRFAFEDGVPLSTALLRIKPPVQPRPLPLYLTSEQIERLMATVTLVQADKQKTHVM